jgi:two-component system, chemotaxis family, sensor kinase CheA
LKDIRQKLLATFQIEHRDHVEQIRSLLAMIGKTTAQPGAELDEAFRRAHSLKGAARAVDLHPVEGLAHRLETLFSRVRQGVLLFDTNVAGVVQQVLDASEDCVTALGENRPTPGFGSALQAIERVLGMEPEAARLAEPETAASVPAFQPLETVRITARNFDGLLRSAGGLLAESQRQNQVTEQLKAIASQLAGLEKETQNVQRGCLRSLTRQAGALCRLHQRSAWSLRHLGKQLQQDVWQARMAPAESLMEGYRKIVRDLARDESKEVELRATSACVHADRRVLEALKDPLMHLLRNAISHGIEAPQERTAKGKSPVGLVTLRIDAEGQRLTIAIQDDGRGVDLARVVEVAVRQGILPQADTAPRTPRELARILFRAGFSTSRSVTNLSGRGMGLSVVDEAVRRLQGEVELRPGDGCGTSIRVSVPLSISTHRLLLVSCAGKLFAIPIHAIERLHRIGLSSVQTVEGKPVIILDGQPAALFSMHQLLSLEQTRTSPQPDVLWVMILRSSGKRVAVAVDAFLRETDAVIQDLGPAAAHDGKVSGAVLLEDGDVAFVLNVVELLDTPVHREWPSQLRPSEPEQKPASILVVDDSLTTRTLEKSILEAHGYRVRIAVDGMEALDRLRAEKADLVIADIQMPRLDGFGLLEAMKKDPDLNRLPIIIVTSLERPEDQMRGLSLGADAYIVKRKFDQWELLTAIRQILGTGGAL